MFVKLPVVGGHEGRSVWLNTDQIVSFTEHDQVTRVDLVEGGPLYVLMGPYALASLLDPDNNCEDGGLAQCAYRQYLASPRRGEMPDLDHQTYHAARAESERHAAACEARGYCHACQGHERVLRA